MDNFSFYDFIKFFFDRPDYGADKQWFFQDDFEDPTYDFTSPLRNRTLVMNYICMAFREIEDLSGTYSERQFFFGWQYIIDWACGGSYRHYFFSDEVPISIRVNTVSLMYEIFEKVFAKVCANIPEPDDIGEFSYNRLCFMWWDMFSTVGQSHRQNVNLISHAILENLEKILLLENVMCKQSALHGLGHLYLELIRK